MPAVFDRGELANSRPVYLLDLDFAGRRFRLATEPIVVSSSSGALSYEGGLEEPDFEQELARQDIDIDGHSVTVSAFLPVDVAELRHAGHELTGGRGELSMVTVRDGAPLQTHENRFSLLVGRIEDPRYGDPEMPAGFLECSVAEPALSDSGLLVAPAARINATTWPSARAAAADKVYPFVLGNPSKWVTAAGVDGPSTGGSPAYVVTPATGSADRVLIAGHAVQATQVRIKGGGKTSGLLTPTNEVDGLGRMCATVTISGEDLALRDATEHWTHWSTGGGFFSPYEASQSLRRAGDICRWMLTQTTIPVDHGRWAAAAPFLNRVIVGTYINDPDATAWDFLADNLLPLLPVSIRRGPSGLYPVLLDLEARRADTIHPVTVAPDFQRVGPFIQEGSVSDIRNRFTIQFAHDGVDGVFRRRRILTPMRDADDLEQLTSLVVQLSARRYNRRTSEESSDPLIDRDEEFECDILYDDPSAQTVLHWMSRLKGFLPERAEYEADVTFGWLQLGDLVLVADDAGQMHDRVGLIVGRAWTGMAWRFSISFDEDMPREPRELTSA